VVQSRHVGVVVGLAGQQQLPKAGIQPYNARFPEQATFGRELSQTVEADGQGHQYVRVVAADHLPQALCQSPVEILEGQFFFIEHVEELPIAVATNRFAAHEQGIEGFVDGGHLWERVKPAYQREGPRQQARKQVPEKGLQIVFCRITQVILWFEL